MSDSRALPSHSDTRPMDELDAYAASNLDSPTRHRYTDLISGRPRWVGFNVVNSDGCFLTELTESSSDQIWLSREQIEWLASEGLPALLKEMGDA